MLLGEYLQRPTYRILQTIGEGNQGVCRRGVHQVFNKDIVQKTVSMLGIPDSVLCVSEPAILKEIKHERIVQVWEAQWDPDPTRASLRNVTFVMPYYAEGSLHQALVSNYRFSVRETIQIASDILSALHHMHAVHGLVHRDLKPANVLLENSRKHGCLADLGSAAYIDPASGGVSSQLGTPLYQAPEARPSGMTTPVSDVYAAGMLMVEMLNGRFPYDDFDPDEVEARLNSGKRALADRWYEPAPWVPRPLATFIRAVCRRDPAGRPTDASTALTRLQRLRVVDWCHTSGDGLAGTWIGYWPPEKTRAEQRITEVSTVPITKGTYKGKLRATTRWRRSNGAWRSYAQLTRQLEPDQSAVGEYFRAVDEVAQSAPTQ